MNEKSYEERAELFLDEVIEKGEIVAFIVKSYAVIVGKDPICNPEPILALAKDPDNTVGNIHYKPNGKYEHWFTTDVKPSTIMLSFAHLADHRKILDYKLNRVKVDGDITHEDEILLQYSSGLIDFLPCELVGFCERLANRNKVVRRAKETFPNWDLVFKIKIPDEVYDIIINEINNEIKEDIEFKERTKGMKYKL